MDGDRVQGQNGQPEDVYCSPLRHGASELSILRLTQQEVSHAPLEMGC
jgi:hypothetical protein